MTCHPPLAIRHPGFVLGTRLTIRAQPKSDRTGRPVARREGAAGGVDQLGLGVEAEPPVDRGGQVGGGDRVGGGVGAVAVAGAVDVAPLDAAAGEHGRVAVGPVVAAGVAVDPGRPAELAERDDQGRVEQAAGVEVLDQGRQAPVGDRQQVVAVLVEDLEVGVPVLPLLAEVVDVDERDAGLDQPAGQQQVLAAHLAGDSPARRRCRPPPPEPTRGRLVVVAVAVAESRILAVEFAGPRGSPASRGAGTPSRRARPSRAASSSSPTPLPTSIASSRSRRRTRRAGARSSGVVSSSARVGASGGVDDDLERVVGRPEEAAALAGDVDDVAEGERQGGVRHVEPALAPEVAQRPAEAGEELRLGGEELLVALRRRAAGEGLHRGRVVQAVAVGHAPDQGDLVHDRRHHRQVLGDEHAGGRWWRSA